MINKNHALPTTMLTVFCFTGHWLETKLSFLFLVLCVVCDEKKRKTDFTLGFAIQWKSPSEMRLSSSLFSQSAFCWNISSRLLFYFSVPPCFTLGTLGLRQIWVAMAAVPYCWTIHSCDLKSFLPPHFLSRPRLPHFSPCLPIYTAVYFNTPHVQIHT